MIEQSVESVIKAAELARSSNKKWHFHILSPTCCFNDRKDCYGLVVENTSDAITLVAYTAERPAEEGKRLVSLLHGAEVLTGVGCPSMTNNKAASLIIRRAKSLNERGISWHHHMLFPDCTLNTQQGSWNLIFEDPESGETISAVYASEPIEDLREVEALFYAQAK